MKRSITDHDIKDLRGVLSNTNAIFLTPSDPAYTTSIARWSRAAEKPAGACVIPTTASKAALALRYATTHSLDPTVKGGGHSTAGASSTASGLLIDLRLAMHGIIVDPSQQLLYVQGGVVWDDVNAAARKHGLATVGGTVADTGVGWAYARWRVWDSFWAKGAGD
jgi:FAD/FMN-containing dehydrogenase